MGKSVATLWPVVSAWTDPEPQSACEDHDPSGERATALSGEMLLSLISSIYPQAGVGAALPLLSMNIDAPHLLTLYEAGLVIVCLLKVTRLFQSGV